MINTNKMQWLDNISPIEQYNPEATNTTVKLMTLHFW